MSLIKSTKIKREGLRKDSLRMYKLRLECRRNEGESNEEKGGKCSILEIIGKRQKRTLRDEGVT